MAASPIVLISRTGHVGTSAASTARRRHAAELLGGDLAAQRGEADQIGEAHDDVLGPREPARAELVAADHAAAGDLPQVGVQRREEHRSDRGAERLGHLGEAQRDVVLGVPTAEERGGERAADRGGEPRHALGEHPVELRDRLLRQSGVQKQRQRLVRGDVLLAEDAIVGPGFGESQRASVRDHLVDVEAGALGDLARRVAGAQGSLQRQQHEPVLGDRRLELLEADAVGRQTLEQLEPSRSLITLEPVQQSRSGEVHGRHPRAPAIGKASRWRHRLASAALAGTPGPEIAPVLV
jgi:hypothetical protein